MNEKLKSVVRCVFYPLVVLRRKILSDRKSRHSEVDKLFEYDKELFLKYSGATECDTQEKLLAKIILSYHVIEKGLTMPRRRLDFGHGAVCCLIDLIHNYQLRYDDDDLQVNYAIGVILEYKKVHDELGCELSDSNFRQSLNDFCAKYCNHRPSAQLQFTREMYFGDVEAPFAQFARSRHSCRHFEGVVETDRIVKAVELSMTAPSACNRQHWRVHCVSNHNIRDAIFDIQKGKGNRGFGEDADKLLIVTSDLQDLQWVEERNDVFVNGGMFLMNLCYALHYSRIANCILNWSVSVEGDRELHKRAQIPECERIVGMIACGNAPSNFSVAVSKRKDVSSILTFH